MKKRILAMLAAAIMCFSLAAPAFATSAEATPAPTLAPTPTPDPRLVYEEDLEGADGTISDAQGMLDGIYDNLPELNGGVVGFMGVLIRNVLPTCFISVFTVWMILRAFSVFLRFLWQ